MNKNKTNNCNCEFFTLLHSFNCLSCFYSYLELQDDFAFRNLFLSISSCIHIACFGLMIPNQIQVSTGLMAIGCQDFLSTSLMQIGLTTCRN